MPDVLTPKVPRAGGFPKVPAPTSPVCTPFASAFQRPLTAHAEARWSAVVLPAIDAFQRPSSQRLLHYWSPSGFHGKISAIITECRCAVAKVRHERAAMEGAEAAKRRQEQLEKEVREYHERDGRQMGSGGKQPLDQLLACGAAHQRCYVRRRKRVVDDRAKVAEEEARLNELRARSRAGKERLARISERTLQEWQGTMDGGRIPVSQPSKEEEAEAIAEAQWTGIRRG